MKAELVFGDHAGPLTVLALHGVEELSSPFRYLLDFVGQDFDVAAAPASRVHLHLSQPVGGERHLDAVCESISFVPVPMDAGEHLTRFRAVLVPGGALVLSLRRGFRVFQQKSVVEIAQKVWKDAGLNGDSLDVAKLQGKYPSRELCCQYDESEWDFICRLLEDEGIFFAFRHDSDGHVLELRDASADVEALDLDTLSFNAEPRAAFESRMVWEWETTAELCVAKVQLTDVDFERPSKNLKKEASASDVPERLFVEYPGGYTDPQQGDRRAKTRLQELRSPSRRGRCRTNALFAMTGRRFTLSGHPDADGDQVITRVEVDVRLQPESTPGPLVDVGPQLVQVSLQTVPKDQPWRPARLTPRPRRPGLQTARVTGPSGSEIHCDKHGRVKLQFTWDREGKLDDKTSAWVRVAQPHTTGGVLLPRVGWEVLVEFLEGNPDRPVCLGRLWNAYYPPPVELPAGRTQTVHGSHSSPGAERVNEVVFEDAAGAEQINIRAARDVLVQAANNKLFSVGHDFRWMVHGQRTVTVGGDQKMSVSSNASSKVGGDETVRVGVQREVKVSGSATEEAAANLNVTIGAMHQVQVGNPVQALLDVIKRAAITAATGAAAGAASRAEAALLGPIMPALQKAREALGTVTSLTGPAAAFLGPGNPQIAAINTAAKTMSDSAGAMDASDIATGLAAKALADDAPEAAAQASQGGSGTWATVVGGNMVESIGGVAALSSVSGISLAVGGASTETVGAVRIEAIAGGKIESTRGAKVETVGALYMADIQESLAINAGSAVAETVAAISKHAVKGSHAIAAQGSVLVIAPRLQLKAKGSITLTCGSTRVTLESNGVGMDGGSSLNIQGSKVEVDEGVLGGP